jgi:hypothetical protein
VKNKIEDLRNHLFATLEALQDTDKPMDIERAKAISDVAQTIINSAKVEVDFAKVTGKTPASLFLPTEEHTNGSKRITRQ